MRIENQDNYTPWRTPKFTSAVQVPTNSLISLQRPSVSYTKSKASIKVTKRSSILSDVVKNLIVKTEFVGIAQLDKILNNTVRVRVDWPNQCTEIDIAPENIVGIENLNIPGFSLVFEVFRPLFEKVRYRLRVIEPRTITRDEFDSIKREVADDLRELFD